MSESDRKNYTVNDIQVIAASDVEGIGKATETLTEAFYDDPPSLYLYSHFKLRDEQRSVNRLLLSRVYGKMLGDGTLTHRPFFVMNVGN